MKTKTLQIVHKYMETGDIYFHDEGFAAIHLTNGKLCDIIQMEYGIRPKKKRIFIKRLNILINDLLRFILKDIEHGKIESFSD